MRSIINNLKFDDFKRIRVGVSRPQNGQDLASFVLSKFKKEEMDSLNESLQRSAYAVEAIIKEGIDVSMNKYNG